MTWDNVLAAFKSSLCVTPVLMCVIFCGLLLFAGVRDFGWMVLAKVAAFLAGAIVLTTVLQLFTDWVISWGVK